MLVSAAFAVSWKQRSFLATGLLASSGMVGLVYGLIVTEFFSKIVFPGPIIGVMMGVGIIGFVVAKEIVARIERRRLLQDS